MVNATNSTAGFFPTLADAIQAGRARGADLMIFEVPQTDGAAPHYYVSSVRAWHSRPKTGRESEARVTRALLTGRSPTGWILRGEDRLEPIPPPATPGPN
jgi:hypothetical protein